MLRPIAAHDASLQPYRVGAAGGRSGWPGGPRIIVICTYIYIYIYVYKYNYITI